MAMIEINKNPSVKDLRWFALFWFPAFMGLVGGLLLHKTGILPLALGLWIAGAVVALIGLVAPKAVRVVFLGWMYAAYPIGFVVSHLMLAGIYFGIMLPIGLTMRLIGRDPLHLKRDPSAKSYWVRRKPAPGVDHYFKQF